MDLTRTKARGFAFFLVKIVPNRWFIEPIKLAADFRSSLKLLTPSAKARWAKHCLKEVDGLSLKILQALGKRRCCLLYLQTYLTNTNQHHIYLFYHSRGLAPFLQYTVKKVSDIPVPSRDVTYQTLPVQGIIN
jgi:hypothetical protein